jgi:glutamate/tyrosine decarboxylase-like PLP-dependent enzyme
VPYDAGYILVRDGQHQLETFSSPAHYLKRETRGMAAGSPWPCDLGPDLSRGFRALKTWFTLATFGAAKLGEMMDNTCELASHLANRIRQEPRLELLAPVNLNIVCFRYVGVAGIKKLTIDQSNRLNNELVIRLQELGRTTPSSTMISAQFAIRAAFVNHRTTRDDVDTLIESTLRIGDELLARPDF